MEAPLYLSIFGFALLFCAMTSLVKSVFQITRLSPWRTNDRKNIFILLSTENPSRRGGAALDSRLHPTAAGVMACLEPPVVDHTQFSLRDAAGGGRKKAPNSPPDS